MYLIWRQIFLKECHLSRPDGKVCLVQGLGTIWIAGFEPTTFWCSARRPLFSSLVSALLPQVSVAVFGTKIVTYSRLSLELNKGIRFSKFGMETVNPRIPINKDGNQNIDGDSLSSVLQTSNLKNFQSFSEFHIFNRSN
jgi:hypothetical protein